MRDGPAGPMPPASSLDPSPRPQPAVWGSASIGSVGAGDDGTLHLLEPPPPLIAAADNWRGSPIGALTSTPAAAALSRAAI
jgi:hypothetical protein